MIPAVSENDFAFIQRLLRDLSGSILESDKSYLVDTRLGPLLAQHGLTSVADLVAQLRSTPQDGLHRATVEAMMNGETMFFRDIFCFNALRETIIPQLIARRSSERRINIWSACCSTGQEPYSLAMLLVESFPQLANWDIKILATDISQFHISRAREGRYAQFEVNRGLPASLLVKHFDNDGTDWVIRDAIRRRVYFEELNLMRPWPVLPLMDIVLLRNVMIYWDVERKRDVLARVRAVMRSDSCLILGAAETTFYIDDQFDRLSAESACCFRLK